MSVTDGLASLITDILRKYGGTMKGRGDHDIYDALVRYRAALAESPPALDVERLQAMSNDAARQWNLAQSKADKAYHRGRMTAFVDVAILAATPPTDDDPGDHFAYICEHMIPANECKVVGCTGGKA